MLAHIAVLGGTLITNLIAWHIGSLYKREVEEPCSCLSICLRRYTVNARTYAVIYIRTRNQVPRHKQGETCVVGCSGKCATARLRLSSGRGRLGALLRGTFRFIAVEIGTLAISSLWNGDLSKQLFV